MNLDKIKALIRLANNNPNEHEANLAARRACKILAENDFAILKPQPRTAASKVGGTWNDVKRSTEPQWTSKPSEPFSSQSYDHFNDFFRQYTKTNPFTGGTRRTKNWTDSAPHKDVSSYDEETKTGPQYNSNMRPDGVKQPKRQELRKCVMCGLEIMTYRIKEDPWKCNFCHWGKEQV